MAKKKKSQRKRNFAYSSRGNAQTKPFEAEPAEKPASQDMTVTKPSAVAVATEDQSYLRHDIRVILWLALGCVALEVVLWFLLRHTGLGPKIFGL